MNELAFYNPELDELDDDVMLIEDKPKKRRKRKSNPSYETSAIAMPALLLGLGYVAWVCYNQTRTGLWNWQPWKRLAGRHSLRLRRANPTTTEAERQTRQQREFDRAIEQSLKPSVVTIPEIDVWRAPRHDALEKEVVSFITP